MNIKKSFKVAIAMSGQDRHEVAEKMGISPVTLSGTLNRNEPNGKTIKGLADAFNMKVSEFIALGE